MPRQTFATREFFVSTAENATYQTVLNLPQFFTRLEFTGENQKLHCLTFKYAPEENREAIHVVLSLLPLDEGCTKVTVHGSYGNGCVFKKDLYITQALANVEGALQAATSGITTPFEPVMRKKNLWLRGRQAKLNTAAIIGNVLKNRRSLRPIPS